MLGPGRASRNRPYPLRSSAEPTLLFFDSESKYATIILTYHYHYSANFGVWTTSNKIEWDKANQLLYWYPATDENENQIIIGVRDNLKTEGLPKRVQLCHVGANL